MIASCLIVMMPNMEKASATQRVEALSAFEALESWTLDEPDSEFDALLRELEILIARIEGGEPIMSIEEATRITAYIRFSRAIELVNLLSGDANFSIHMAHYAQTHEAQVVEAKVLASRLRVLARSQLINEIFSYERRRELIEALIGPVNRP